MRLICPGCGLTASAEAWLNDAEARELLLAVATMPAPLPEAVLPYLGLFRPESRALTWKKAGKLVAELAAITGSGYVQVQGKPARPCPPRIWTTAMEQMVARRDRITRPMPNHNYLRLVAWQLADEADAQGERQRNEDAMSGATPARPRIASTNPLAKLMGDGE
ncbi:MAG: hypothetical protein ACOY3Z_06345 [Thermodesulfobacteriota bacterium]